LVDPDAVPAAVFETPTSGGKANAIEVIATNGRGKEGEEDWLVLTDSEQGLCLVIGWDGERFEEVSRVQMMEGDGASHAVWLE
jgi:carboxy-cis,cis-muconate cyclase